MFLIFSESRIQICIGTRRLSLSKCFTPQLPGVSPIYPVIVWVHGGAFCVGSNDSRIYGPDYLLDYGVVLVTINYR